MSHKKSHVLAILLFTCLIGNVQIAVGNTGATPLKVEIEVSGATILVGCPLVATVKLTNRGEDKVLVPIVAANNIDVVQFGRRKGVRNLSTDRSVRGVPVVADGDRKGS